MLHFSFQLGLGRYDLRRKAGFTARVADFYSRREEPEKQALCSVAELIRANRGATLDELCALGGLDYAELASLVNILESDRFVDVDLLQRCTINTKNA